MSSGRGWTAKLAEQPKGVYVLFLTELWERFSYFGMLGLLVLFLVAPASSGGLGWDNASALRVFGTFLGMIWFAPLIGGWVTDRLMDPRRAVLLGCVCLALANMLFASCAFIATSLAVPSGNQPHAFGADYRAMTSCLYGGLVLMVAGAGFLKSNVPVLLGGLFPDSADPRRDFGFTIFYMGVNLGALIAPLIAGTLGERVGWHWGFGVSSLGMLIGIAIFLAFQRRTLGPAKIVRAVHQTPEAAASRPGDARRVMTLAIFALFTTVFAVGLMQYGGLLNLFTAQAIDRKIWGIEIPATWFLTLNPLYVILLGPWIASAWDARSKRGASSTAAHKFFIALVLMSAAFGLIACAALSATAQAPGHWVIIVVFYLVFTVGELCIYPVGLALVSRLAPARFIGVLMGAWLLTNAVGSFVAGQLGALAQTVGNAVVFTGLSVTAALSATLLWIFLKPLGERAG